MPDSASIRVSLDDSITLLRMLTNFRNNDIPRGASCVERILVSIMPETEWIVGDEKNCELFLRELENIKSQCREPRH